MRVFLLKDVEKVGLAGEIVKIKDGFGINYLVPRKLAIVITPANEKFYSSRVKTVEKRKDVIATKTSMLAEKISSLQLKLKVRTHDDGKLYGSVGASDIVDLLAEKGVSISKNQVEFGKSIKSTGTHKITIKLSSKLKPVLTLKVV